MFRQFAISALLGVTPFAMADTFKYDYYFLDNDPIIPLYWEQSFSYVSPVLITTPTTFVADVSYYKDKGPRDYSATVATDAYTVTIDPMTGQFTYFNKEAITASYLSTADLTVGDHFLNYSDTSYLNITDIPGGGSSVPPASSVPEPSTWALIGTGLLGLVGLRGRIASLRV